MRCWWLLPLSAVQFALGCESRGDARGNEPGVPQAAGDALPAAVSIPSGEVAVGTGMSGKLGSSSVGAFRIQKYPALVRDWRRCMASGACGAPAWTTGACAPSAPEEDRRFDGPTLDSGQDDVPVTCVDLAQAQRFCEYLHHGHVPTVAEWMMAARGREIHRFSWGSDARQGCTHRWRLSFAPELPSACCEKDCFDPKARIVGLHPAGDSPFGVSDVLSASAELIAPDSDSAVSACRAEGGCVATGLEPGAIDWIFAAPKSSPTAEGPVIEHAATFRCAWSYEVDP